MDFGPTTKYGRDDFHPSKIRKLTNMWQTVVPKFNGWNTVYLDNHDSGRSLTRYASDAPEHRATAAKMLATYLTTLNGTPFLLMGQEIGMANLSRDYGPDAYIDVEGKNHYHAVLKARGGDESKMSDVMRELSLKARDHGRLPMQWDGSPNAGFTTAEARPWMTINKDHVDWNVASQVDDPNSVLSFWKESLRLRKGHTDLFVYGSYEPVPESSTGEMVFAYRRKSHESGQMAVVFLNFSDKEQKVPAEEYKDFSVLWSNHQSQAVFEGQLALVPFGAMVLTQQQ